MNSLVGRPPRSVDATVRHEPSDLVVAGQTPAGVRGAMHRENYLVSLGMDVNTVDRNQETAMHGAAYRNFPLVVNCLAKHGANSKFWDHLRLQN